MKSFKTTCLANKMPMSPMPDVFSFPFHREPFAPPKVLAQPAEGSVSYVYDTAHEQPSLHVAVANSPLSTFDANALKDIKHYNHYMF